MKKLLLIIFAIALSTQIASSFSGSGSGTTADPYQITNVNQLQEMNNAVGSHYILMNDIDASATSGWNAGAGYDAPTVFTGSLNGNNYTISNLFSDRTTNYVALIGYASNAEIYDVTLSNIDFSGAYYVGGICGLASTNTDIINCHVSGSIFGLENYMGGVAGRISYSNTIKNSSSSATVVGGAFVGGFVGHNTESDISKCFATGNVSGDFFMGGFVGRTHLNATITDCYSRGDVSGGNDVGGFVGYLASYSVLTNCYSVGEVTGSFYVGGFNGFKEPVVTTANCFWDTQTSGMATSAGGTGKTTSEMMQQATFSGWDFANIWGIVETESYPFLGETIPTLTEWAAIFMGILLAGFGVFFIFRRMG